MRNIIEKFKWLKMNNIHIQYLLDIGAYRGEFSKEIRNIWPTCIVKQFEPDVRQKEYLDEGCFFVLLGNEEKEVEYYTLDNNTQITTGSSIYRENTNFYNEKNTIVMKKSMVTLDNLHKKHNFFGDWKNYGMIKLDTQGSEIDILIGAKNFIETKTPRFILSECPVSLYNIGAPKFYDYISYMNKIGYVIRDIFDASYINGKLVQIDILFEREDYENSILD